MPPIGSLSTPTLIGRQQELAVLRTLLESGSGTLLISGEAGMGKSRLAQEAASLCVALGYQVLQGACFDRDQTLPFAPFLDLIRNHAAMDRAEVRQRLTTSAPHFLRLLPELAVPASVATGLPDPASEQRRIFQEVAAFLTELATEQPLLVVLEDIHWSDETSLDLLLPLTRLTSSLPLLLVITFRAEEPGPALSRFLAEIDRRRAATEIALRPLSQSEVEQQLRAILALPRPAGTLFVRSLHALTGGNPFFVEEVLRSLIATGDVYPSDDGWQRKPLDQIRVPRSVEEAVGRRAAHLSPASRELLTLAAVAGQRVDFALLQALSGRTEDALISAIKELITAQLLVEVSPDLFAFRHALTRQAIYSRLLARERRGLHAQMLQAIADGQAGDTGAALENLAYHAFEAGDWTRAAQLSRAAGDRALALHASQAAAEQYGRALAATANLGIPPPPSLLYLQAQALNAMDDFAGARASYEAAFTAAESAADSGTALSSLLGLGLLWSGRDYEQALSWLLRAVEMARALGDPASLAHALNRLGNWYANHEEIDEALRHHDEALAIFTLLGDRAGAAQTLDLLAMANILGGDIASTITAARQAATLFAELGDRASYAAVLPLSVATTAVYELETFAGDLPLSSGISLIEQSLALFREIDWRSGEAFALGILAEGQGAAGEIGAALESVRLSLAIAAEIGHRQWTVQTRWVLGRLYLTLLAPAKARQEMEQVLALAEEIHSSIWISDARAGLASALIAEGEVESAAALLDGVLAETTPTRTQGQRALWAARADLALARGQPQEALAIVNRLYAATLNLRSERDVPRLALIKALALSASGEHDQAEELLRAALLTATQLGAQPMQRQFHLALAGVLRRLDRGYEATREDEAAAEIAARIAATIPEGEMRDAYLLAAGLLPHSPQHDEQKAWTGILTPREHEVAAHIAAGQSNREIAAALFISERTVETHVTNILRKLTLPSRAALAAWVERNGASTP